MQSTEDRNKADELATELWLHFEKMNKPTDSWADKTQDLFAYHISDGIAQRTVRKLIETCRRAPSYAEILETVRAEIANRPVIADPNFVTCPNCQGSGWMTDRYEDADGNPASRLTGYGIVIGCERCGGFSRRAGSGRILKSNYTIEERQRDRKATPEEAKVWGQRIRETLAKVTRPGYVDPPF